MSEIGGGEAHEALSPHQQRELIIQYAQSQPETFAGSWHEVDSPDQSLVLAFTDPVERYLSSLRSLVPNHELFRVVQHRFSYRHLEEVTGRMISILGTPEGLTMWGPDEIRNVVAVRVLPDHLSRVRRTLAATNPDDVIVEPGSHIIPAWLLHPTTRFGDTFEVEEGWTSGHFERRNRLERRTKQIPFNFEVVTGLQVDPEALTRAEIPCEPQRRVGADPALAMNDLVDPARRDADRDRQAVLRDPEWLKEVHHQDLAGVDRSHGRRHRCPLSGHP